MVSEGNPSSPYLRRETTGQERSGRSIGITDGQIQRHRFLSVNRRLAQLHQLSRPAPDPTRGLAFEHCTGRHIGADVRASTSKGERSKPVWLSNGQWLFCIRVICHCGQSSPETFGTPVAP